MRLIHQFCFLILLLPSMVSAQDTMRIDTTLCVPLDFRYFTAPYDTTSYDFEWFTIPDNELLAVTDSIDVLGFDSLLLVSTPIDMSQEIQIDSFYFSFRFAPNLLYVIPPVECYIGNSLCIMDNSTIDTVYTDVSYTTSNGEELFSIDSLIKISVGNGESLELIAKYEIEGCAEVDSAIQLTTLFTPQINFVSDTVCSGEITTISNFSDYDSTISSFLLEVVGLDTFDISEDAFNVFIPENGDTIDVFVKIEQGTCLATDTFQIINKLQPTAVLDITQTCENEMLRIVNGSSDITPDPLYTININSMEYAFLQSSEFTISDTLAHDTYTALGIVDNKNGCIDSLSFAVLIDSVTYASFENLDSEYCELEGISTLIGSPTNGNGVFDGGVFVEDLGNGEANFNPKETAKDINVTYSYTNTLGCTDIDLQIVDTVYRKPILSLSGLDMAYCELDSASDLMLSPSIAFNTMASYEIMKNGILIDTQNSFDYTFDPIEPGIYSILNFYKDVNDCIDSLVNTTTVNPLPNVELGLDTFITPGQSILIGNIAGAEPNVDYNWSDGSDMSSLDVELPGIYYLFGENDSTGCIASDTIKIEFDALETKLIGITIAPNPTMGEVTITLTAPAQNIRILDVFGVPLIGVSSFSTNINDQLILDMSIQASGYYYILIPNVGNFLLLKL